MNTKKVLGNAGEELALNFLLKKGYKLVAKNFTTSAGEIDLIVASNTYIVFVEVKTRLSELYGDPIEAVDIHKQRKIRIVADIFLARGGYSRLQPRFDIITLNHGKLEHYVDAF